MNATRRVELDGRDFLIYEVGQYTESGRKFFGANVRLGRERRILPGAKRVNVCHERNMETEEELMEFFDRARRTVMGEDVRSPLGRTLDNIVEDIDPNVGADSDTLDEVSAEDTSYTRPDRRYYDE